MLLLIACGSDPAPKPAPTPVTTTLEEVAKPSPKKAAPRLEAAVLTSTGNADGLVRGTDAWAPIGDPDGEGLLLRFSEPLEAEFFEVAACSTGGAWTATIYINGARIDDQRLEPGQVADVLVETEVKSVFVRMSRAEVGACMGAVRFLDEGEKDLGVLPPRKVGVQVNASSTLSPANAYHTQYLVDARTDFGWVEGAKGLGVGEELSLSLDEATTVHGIRIWNGYQRSEDHFAKNARLKKVTLRFDEGRVVLEVPDTMGPSDLRFDQPVVTRSLSLTIDEAVPGSKYEDLVISELALLDDQGVLGLTQVDERDRSLREEQAGTPLGALMDHQLESACTDERITHLKLRSNHSFVVYDESMDSSTVFDGAWVPVGRDGPWTSVKLYGRKHRITSTWQPYGADTTDESTRIGGGTLRIARAADLDEEGWVLAKIDMAWGLGCMPEISHADAIAKDIVLMTGADLDNVLAR